MNFALSKVTLPSLVSWKPDLRRRAVAADREGDRVEELAGEWT